jgi:chromosome segregation ATPase
LLLSIDRSQKICSDNLATLEASCHEGAEETKAELVAQADATATGIQELEKNLTDTRTEMARQLENSTRAQDESTDQLQAKLDKLTEDYTASLAAGLAGQTEALQAAQEATDAKQTEELAKLNAGLESVTKTQEEVDMKLEGIQGKFLEDLQEATASLKGVFDTSEADNRRLRMSDLEDVQLLRSRLDAVDNDVDGLGVGRVDTVADTKIGASIGKLGSDIRALRQDVDSAISADQWTEQTASVAGKIAALEKEVEILHTDLGALDGKLAESSGSASAQVQDLEAQRDAAEQARVKAEAELEALRAEHENLKRSAGESVAAAEAESKAASKAKAAAEKQAAAEEATAKAVAADAKAAEEQAAEAEKKAAAEEAAAKEATADAKAAEEAAHAAEQAAKDASVPDAA